jgi:hypothetical protein
MTQSSAAHLAKIRRHALTGEATYSRQPPPHRIRRRNLRRRGLDAFHSWLAAGQL